MDSAHLIHFPDRQIDRYVLCDLIGVGGMGTVHFGRLLGAAGFARTVAIKRMHPNLLSDATAVAMFHDEARITGHLRHPNISSVIDVLEDHGELYVVLEYVHGETLSRLMAAMNGAHIPVNIALGIICQVLYGLHAAHETTDNNGKLLHLIHRDVSPQNIMVGEDGLVRLIDFGIAKSLGRLQTTHTGQIKGKFTYMAPEQFTQGVVDRRADIYASAVVLWEMLTSRRLFETDNPGATIHAVITQPILPPSMFRAEVAPAINEICMRALDKLPTNRFANALLMATTLESHFHVANMREIGDWVRCTAASNLMQRARVLAEIEHRYVSDSVAQASTTMSSGHRTSSPDTITSELAAPDGTATEWDPVNPAFGAVDFGAELDVSESVASGNVQAGNSSRPDRSVAHGIVSRGVIVIGGALALVTVVIVAITIISYRNAAIDRLPVTPSISNLQSSLPITLSVSIAPTSFENSIPTPSPSILTLAPNTSMSTPSPSVSTLASSLSSTRRRPPILKRKANCNPPYTVDATGIRTLKPECIPR